ncbi:hypothetical protein DPEC_G00352940 [Dallia pectoralis]|uniref:Uncharacterized protein n=1 Tax=Dallia pectoralis TaxID=75939 RepID=A0ACC2F283_DALPE|nr:hypothetical protein DPEC_G00352940 [Dallia pectoralis]
MVLQCEKKKTTSFWFTCLGLFDYAGFVLLSTVMRKIPLEKVWMETGDCIGEGENIQGVTSEETPGLITLTARAASGKSSHILHRHLARQTSVRVSQGLRSTLFLSRASCLPEKARSGHDVTTRRPFYF